MTGVLVRGAWVLTMGAAGDIADGAVLLNGDLIIAIGPYRELRARHPEAAVVGDGTGIVTPGLVNAHTHLSEALIPGMGSELTLFEWGSRIVTPVGERLTAEMAEEGTVLKAIELLHSGVTTVNDMFCHSSPGSRASLGVVAGLERAGLRGVVSFGAENGLDGPTDMEPLTVAEILAEHDDLAAAAGSLPAGGVPLWHRHRSRPDRRAARGRDRSVPAPGVGGAHPPGRGARGDRRRLGTLGSSHR